MRIDERENKMGCAENEFNTAHFVLKVRVSENELSATQ